MLDLQEGHTAAARALDERARVIHTDFDGGRMPWRIWGKGKPLILMHGGHGSWTHWIRNIEVLSRAHMVIAPDLPGFGEADALAEITPDHAAAAISGGIAQLDLPHDLGLAAFSFGCSLLGEVLPLLGKRPKRLILIGTWMLGRSHDLSARFQRWQELPAGPDRDAVMRHNLHVLMLHHLERIDDEAIRLQTRNVQMTRKGIMAMIGERDIFPRLRNAPCPVTCLYGAQDALVTGYLEDRPAFLADMPKGSRMVVLPDAGHWLQYEAADAVNALLQDEMTSHWE